MVKRSHTFSIASPSRFLDLLIFTKATSSAKSRTIQNGMSEIFCRENFHDSQSDSSYNTSGISFRQLFSQISNMCLSFSTLSPTPQNGFYRTQTELTFYNWTFYICFWAVSPQLDTIENVDSIAYGEFCFFNDFIPLLKAKLGQGIVVAYWTCSTVV